MSQQSQDQHFDIIIAGAGAAGLSLLYRLLDSPALNQKKILVVDKDKKKANDRTWCFWEKEPDVFEPIVFKSWQSADFFNPGFAKYLDLQPYTYKMIRGIDFYNHVFHKAQQCSNVTFMQAEIEDMRETDHQGIIKVNNETIYAEWIFNSLPPPRPENLPGNKYYLLQHFKGYIIETAKAHFDPDKVVFMDFRVEQNNEVRFGYALPFSQNRALVEFTVFSKELLPREDYDVLLKHYIENQLSIGKYEIKDQEFGVIPMTNLNWQKQDKKRIINIGTVGGYTKASTGYTFKRIQEITELIVKSYEQTGKPLVPKHYFKSRFMFYDSVLLGVLARNLCPSNEVFGNLFKRNPPELVFKFLDEKTSFAEELKIISTLPWQPFLKAVMGLVR